MDKKNFFNDIGRLKNMVGYTVAIQVYKKIFHHHFNSFKPTKFEVSDFTNLERVRYTFKGNENQTLVGYMYTSKGITPTYLMVFAHGLGGGHSSYLDLIDYFARQGFAVFAYDATACDESEGDSIKSFVQGYIDANSAINYAEKLEGYNNLPLVLCGHSWGAYSMMNALGDHKETYALIDFSGFITSTAIFKANGYIYTNNSKQSQDLYNYVDTLEENLWGKLAKLNAVDSIKDSNCKVVFVHSEDDKTVPIIAGLDYFDYVLDKEDRFLYIRLKDKGHGTVYCSTDGKKYIDDFYKVLNSYAKLNKVDEKAKEEKGVELINRDILSHKIDENMLDQIVRFIKN